MDKFGRLETDKTYRSGAAKKLMLWLLEGNNQAITLVNMISTIPTSKLKDYLN